jgi:AbrB family looped-hinge helix DNA binding protein
MKGMTVTVDRAGRVVLPKALRDELQLQGGDMLELVVEGEQFTLRPQRNHAPLHKERGVWVFRRNEPLTEGETREALRQIREHRAGRNAGNAK